MSYIYNGGNGLEHVEKERWWWLAVYDDGTTLEQFDRDGYFHKFAEIDWARLSSFGLVSEDLPSITILWREGMKPIHFYRNYILDLGGQNIRTKLYCIGYQNGAEKCLFVVMPDNSVMVTDDIDNITMGV